MPLPQLNQLSWCDHAMRMFYVGIDAVDSQKDYWETNMWQYLLYAAENGEI